VKRLEDQLSAMPNDLQRDLREVDADSERRMVELAEAHHVQASKLETEAADVQNDMRNQRLQQHEKTVHAVRDNDKLLEDHERKLAADLVRRRNDWEALLAMLIETIEVRTKALEDIRTRFETKPGRQCDHDRIVALAIQLKGLKLHLAAKLKDFAQYKGLMIDQEKVYNSHFGQMPSVAVLQTDFRAPARSARA
jgi:hypothetical protein